MAVHAGVLHLAHLGPGAGLSDIYWTNFGTGTWSAQLSIPDHVGIGAPALAPLGNRLMMVHQGNIGIESNAGLYSNLWSSTYLPTL